MSNAQTMGKDLEQFDRNRHGGLYDRGSADAWHRRSADPHWYPMGTYRGSRVTDLNPYEIAEYHEGYSDTEKAGCFKEW